MRFHKYKGSGKARMLKKWSGGERMGYKENKEVWQCCQQKSAAPKKYDHIRASEWHGKWNENLPPPYVLCKLVICPIY